MFPVVTADSAIVLPPLVLFSFYRRQTKRETLMLACGSRSLFRHGRILNLTNFSSVLRPHNFSQSYQAYHGLSCKLKMAGEKDKHKGGYKSKKLRTANTVWRPIVTQVSSREGSSVNQITVESEDDVQIEDVNHDTETTVSNAQSVINVTEAAIQITGSAANSTISHDNREDIVSKEPIVSSEKHAISVWVGASLMRYIKGKGWPKQKKNEEEMRVQIIFPSSRKEESVIIEGASIDSVTKASEKIQAIIDEAVNSPNLDYSHFISLPLAIHPELVDKLVTFQNSILGCDPSVNEDLDVDSSEDCSETETEGQKTDKGPDVAVELKVDNDNERIKVNIANIPLVSYAPKASKSSLPDLGVDKSIFIKPKTFHLTVLMLKLWNKDRVDAAAEVLQSISTKVMDALDNRPVSIKLKGLDCMRGSLAKARVLYAPVEEIGSEGRLMDACQVIIDAFVQAGLVLEKDAKQKLKLHATVMNARHRKRKKHTRKVDFFDARSIFQQYGAEEWGEYVIHEAHLSQRFVFDENGYYHCCAFIPFPEDMQED